MALAPTQVREAIIRLGMTKREFATFCGGGGERAAHRWLAGERRLKGAAEILVRLALGLDLRTPDKAMRDRIMGMAQEVSKRRQLERRK